jgi:hypothetical protein
MRTALELLSPHQSLWPSESPKFRIRCKVVGLDEILRSCRRRGIRDPFEWIRSTPAEGPLSPDVEILTPSTSADAKSDAADFCESPAPEAFEDKDPGHGCALTEVGAGHGDRESMNCSPPSASHASNGPAMDRLREPDMYILAAQAILQIRSFCLNYAASPRSIMHTEPPVHQFTCHARLQNHVNEGLFHLARRNVNLAFTKFRLGFLVLEEVLNDVHPMSLAQYLMLLCNLTTKKAHVVAGKLLEQTSELASTRPHVPPSLVDALHVIYRSGEFLEVPLLCLRTMSECMEADKSLQWKRFYVKERYCDALYHACLSGEGALRREELLQAQEAHYGASARNVLVTSLNVADDLLTQIRLDEAERRFNRVLEQSEDLSGFHRAKIRVVALSGLARVAIVRMRQWCDRQGVRMPGHESSEIVLQRLRSAAGFVRDALDLAEIWFEGSAWRIEILHELQTEVLAMCLRAGVHLEEGHPPLP